MPDIIIFLFIMAIFFKIASKAGSTKKIIKTLKNSNNQNIDLQNINFEKIIKENKINSDKESHIHSKSNYKNKNYVENHDHSIIISTEPPVKRSIFDKRGSGKTIERKNYD